ncbi:MAG: transposase [Lachnospiraceae bacterium]|nr:transposase [Lachnospiraceae bacterium]
MSLTWARGYYAATVGNITEEAVKEYIQRQKEESKREDPRK